MDIRKRYICILKNEENMQRPNRGAVLFVMPLAIFMLIIGWILLSAGSTKSKPNKNFYAKRTNFHIATQSTNLLA